MRDNVPTQGRAPPFAEHSAEGPRLADAELISAHLDGKLAAYGELVRRYQIPLFRLMLGLLGDEDVAERACEQVFVVANRRLHQLVHRSGFYCWLLGIAREVSRDVLARRDAPSRPPQVRVPRDQLKREVHRVLQKLDPDQRLALILVELRDADHDEVAAALGRTPSEVPELLARARAAFIAALEQGSSNTIVERSGETTHGNAARLSTGDLVDRRYRIESLLGAGGMGAVYRATRLEDRREVALKTMLPDLCASEDALRRFEREARAIARIDHENFVKVLDSGRTDDDMRYLVMEYLQGRSLRSVAKAEAPLEPTRALRIVRDLLRGLEHAHAAGVVHRDLKPDNVLLVATKGERERPKILDLGLARLIDDDDGGEGGTRLTRRGTVFGTPAYMAPEQALGEEADARADLYAVSVMLYQLLTGQLPFQARNAATLLVLHVSQTAPKLTAAAPHLIEMGEMGELEQLLVAGLAKRPDERLPDATTYLSRLERVLQRARSGPGRGRRPAEPPARAGSTERPGARDYGQRDAGEWWLVVLIALIILSVVCWSVWS
ncbi:Serine/threonine-protein kinase PK-1 [Enhygromyxa salina]|uniref:Serine/threonine-protein kinase PK-1 n=1 Tax=Enhygromyxa salina TaxID=215803 RepID=A0A2S9YEX9_9BACT|nr:protein kinase [Enhygromyxa salina]PRQ03592.1 Serine/threonine-protein kinase PK-1 [Enhygromyxa salina]